MNAYIANPKIITCLGNNQETWNGLIEGRSGLTPAEQAYPEWFEGNCSKVGILKEIDNSAPSRLTQIIKKIDANCIDQSALNLCDIVIGASSLGDLTGPFEGDPYGCIKQYLSKNHQGISEKFKTVITSACSSGTDVISMASSLVDSGTHDIVGVLAADCLDPGKILQHITLGTQARDQARPFDESRSGTSFGEGGGFALVVNQTGLTKLQKAFSNNVHYYSIKGFGMSCDAKHITAPDETGEIPALAIQRAINSANIKCDDIGYINAHASGTPINDTVESVAINKVFKSSLDNTCVGGSKGAIGHLLGATGFVEAVICCIALDYKTAPGTVGLTSKDKKIQLPVSASGIPAKFKQHIAMSITFGFGGVNSAIALMSA